MNQLERRIRAGMKVLDDWVKEDPRGYIKAEDHEVVSRILSAADAEQADPKLPDTRLWSLYGLKWSATSTFNKSTVKRMLTTYLKSSQLSRNGRQPQMRNVSYVVLVDDDENYVALVQYERLIENSTNWYVSHQEMFVATRNEFDPTKRVSVAS